MCHWLHCIIFNDFFFFLSFNKTISVAEKINDRNNMFFFETTCTNKQCTIKAIMCIKEIKSVHFDFTLKHIMSSMDYPYLI